MSNASENTTEKSQHVCCNCDRRFHSSRGLKQHQRSCQSRNNIPTESESTETIEDSQFSTKMNLLFGEKSAVAIWESGKKVYRRSK